MNPALAGTVPTRLIDLSGLSLSDLRRCAPEGVGRACAQLVEEVVNPAMVTLGSTSS
jgi:hypothetical protein